MKIISIKKAFLETSKDFYPIYKNAGIHAK
jgi:hypothetical protein